MNVAIAKALEGARFLARCRRRQVGALVLSTDGRIVGIGWNSLRNGGNCLAGDCPRGQSSYDDIPAFSSYAGNCDAVHAEDAAIRQALGNLDSLEGASILVTCDPCPGCKHLIAESGLVTTVVADPTNYQKGLPQ